MIGRTVSHYRILSALGSGGMGVVYLAEDARLGRQVALKFLPASFSQETEGARTLPRRGACRQLAQPPGASARSTTSARTATRPFIVMEALKGETLRERIAKGPLKVADVLDIGIQLADALEAAHAQGIIHRDIKPANILLSDKNRVKVLDFGLAKLDHVTVATLEQRGHRRPSDRTRTTRSHSPARRSAPCRTCRPSRRVERMIDSRTDLFSLGAVLYEMVTGPQAFGGSTTAVVYRLDPQSLAACHRASESARPDPARGGHRDRARKGTRPAVSARL